MTVAGDDHFQSGGGLPIRACAEGRRPVSRGDVSTLRRLDGEREPARQAGRESDDRAEAVTSETPERTRRRREVLDERVRQLETEVEQLRCAMAHRAPIEQAKGILMLLTGVDEQAAFAILGHISSTTHKKVRDIATAIRDAAAGRGDLPRDIQRTLHDACPPVGRRLAKDPHHEPNG